jgi:hypothetical protein
MSKVERRHERAIAALKAIARTMGNAVFRVEDYRPPHEKRVHTRHGGAGAEQRTETENPPAAKLIGRDGF